jgi:leader peptidase (prepilin peptidase) / N-methyltransferase
MPSEPWLWPAGLGLLGLILGSFLATLVIRWPEDRPVARGRSACDGCGKTLRAHELVPVVSFVLQRGRCRGCGAAIAPGHLAIELAAGAIGVTAGLLAPNVAGACGALFGWLLLTLAALDLAAFWLPNRPTLALAGLALGGLTGTEPLLGERLAGGVAGFAALWLVAAGYRATRGREGLGGGDPKMFGAIGLWLGWQALPAVLLASCLFGLGVVAAMALLGRRVTGSVRLPFGTMLAAGGFGYWLVTAR